MYKVFIVVAASTVVHVFIQSALILVWYWTRVGGVVVGWLGDVSLNDRWMSLVDDRRTVYRE